MTRALKVHPNERIDLEDFELATRDYTNSVVSEHRSRMLTDVKNRFISGFRVEIANQTTSPGQITIYNGLAVDRSGEILTNEDTFNTSRSITLTGASQTFYVEIEFTESETDTDSRAFWDPTVSHTDPTPDGEEFAAPVTTRVAYDWQIVTPVSTTGFQFNPVTASGAQSTRVPLCVLSTNGSNQIATGGTNPGLTLVKWKGVLENDITAGASTAKVHDVSSLTAGVTTVTVGAGTGTSESATISTFTSDGVITFSAPLANNHTAGDAIWATTGPDFMAERTTPEPATGHPDWRRFIYRGSETRGKTLITEQSLSSVRGDISLRSLKDYVDFNAALMRELKWGSPDYTVVSTTPPAAFAAAPRYFDKVGSVAGARGAMLSIGDGATSFGDFNGTTEAPLIAALAALPAGGGTIYIRRGQYTFSNAVSITKEAFIVGDGPTLTDILVDTSGSITVTLGAADLHMAFRDLGIAVSGLTTTALTLNDGIHEFTNVRVNGRVNVADVDTSIRAYNSVFTNGGVNEHAIEITVAAGLTNSTFDSCEITAGAGATTKSAVRISDTTCGTGNSFTRCRLTGTGAAAVSTAGGDIIAGTVFRDCKFAGDASAIQANGALNVVIDNANFEGITGVSATLPVIDFQGTINDVHIVNTRFPGANGSSGTPARHIYLAGSVIGTSVENCYFLGTSGQYVKNIEFNDIVGNGSLKVTGCMSYGAHSFVYDSSTVANSEITVQDCHVSGLINAINQFLVYAGGRAHIRVKDSTFKDCAGAGAKVAIYSVADATNTRQLDVTGCKFSSIVSTSGIVSAILHDTGRVTGLIEGNHIHTVTTSAGTSSASGITVLGIIDATEDQLIVADNVVHNIQATGATSNAYGIRLDSLHGVSAKGGTVSGVVATTQALGMYLRLLQQANVGGIAVKSITSSGASYSNTGGVFSDQCQSLVIDGLNIQSLATVEAGIKVTQGGVSDGVSVLNCKIKCGTARNGIRFVASGGGVGDWNTTVRGNKVSDMTDTIANGIVMNLGNNVRNLMVDNNQVYETTYAAGHNGIYIEGGVGTRAINVTVAKNNVLMDMSYAGGATTRTGTGIYVAECDEVKYDGNNIHWADGALLVTYGATAPGGFLLNCNGGSICDNIVYPDGGANSELLYTSVTYFVVDGNIVGMNGITGQHSTGIASCTYGTNKTA